MRAFSKLKPWHVKGALQNLTQLNIGAVTLYKILYTLTVYIYIVLGLFLYSCYLLIWRSSIRIFFFLLFPLWGVYARSVKDFIRKMGQHVETSFLRSQRQLHFSIITVRKTCKKKSGSRQEKEKLHGI